MAFGGLASGASAPRSGRVSEQVCIIAARSDLRRTTQRQVQLSERRTGGELIGKVVYGKGLELSNQRHVERTFKRLGLGSFEPRNRVTYSQRKLRTLFIREAENFTSELGATLYEEAFFEFVRLAWSEFPQSIPVPVATRLEDQKLLGDLRHVAIEFSESITSAEDNKVHRAFAEVLIPAFIRDQKLVFDYPRYSLMQELLGPLRKHSKAVRRTFSDWATLKRIKAAGPLCEAVIRWSKRWNLEADWCRDYAVAALCAWLSDEWLQLRLGGGERWALSFSRATVDRSLEDLWAAQSDAYFPTDDGRVELLSHMTEDFRFAWNNLEFQHGRWNVFTRYRSTWVQECDDEFEAYVIRYKESGGKMPTGALSKFRARRDEYVRGVARVANAAIAECGATPRRWASDHLNWAVMYQLQKLRFAEIGRAKGAAAKTIADGVNRTLEFIGLTRRPCSRTGRPSGIRENRSRLIARK